MDAVVTPMHATAESISLRLIVSDRHPIQPTGWSLIVDRRIAQIGPWRSMGSADHKVWFASAVVDNLDSGTAYDVELRHGGEIVDRATATTLPGAGQPAGLVIGSCFDSDQKHARVEQLHSEAMTVLREAGAIPLNLWLGDQVYVDAPWKRGFLPSDPCKKIVDKYRASWGVDSDGKQDRLAHAMAHGSNWFLPDDHEFWNGFPHPSFITLPFHTAGRLAVQSWRRARRSNTFPHPWAQGAWGRTAGEAYCVFQTSLDFERFSEDVNPTQIQRIELDGLVILLADTRWHRTILKTGGRAGFMREGDLDELVDVLEAETRLVCLGLSRPIVGHLPHKGPVRSKIEYSPEDYSRQYSRLWRALNVRADAGHPTIVVGGDVHTQSVATANEGRLLEVTSSPLAELHALDESAVAKARRGWAKLKAIGHSGFERVSRTRSHHVGNDPSVTPYPIVAEDESWEVGSGNVLVHEAKVTSGIAALTVDTSDDGHPVVEVFLARAHKGARGQWRRSFKWVDGWQ